jgi:hypothetical protein
VHSGVAVVDCLGHGAPWAFCAGGLIIAEQRLPVVRTRLCSFRSR